MTETSRIIVPIPGRKRKHMRLLPSEFANREGVENITPEEIFSYDFMRSAESFGLDRAVNWEPLLPNPDPKRIDDHVWMALDLQVSTKNFVSDYQWMKSNVEGDNSNPPLWKRLEKLLEAHVEYVISTMECHGNLRGMSLSDFCDGFLLPRVLLYAIYRRVILFVALHDSRIKIIAEKLGYAQEGSKKVGRFRTLLSRLQLRNDILRDPLNSHEVFEEEKAWLHEIQQNL